MSIHRLWPRLGPRWARWFPLATGKGLLHESITEDVSPKSVYRLPVRELMDFPSVCRGRVRGGVSRRFFPGPRSVETPSRCR